MQKVSPNSADSPPHGMSVACATFGNALKTGEAGNRHAGFMLFHRGTGVPALGTMAATAGAILLHSAASLAWPLA